MEQTSSPVAVEYYPAGTVAPASVETIKRYSRNAQIYDRYRWSYASTAIDAIMAHANLDTNSVVADIGAGTGMLGAAFLGRVAQVFAVEPNDAMRAVAEQQMALQPTYRAINGRAEETTLSDQSVDCVVVGRAIHWFSPQKSGAEFRRILKPGGWLAILRTPAASGELATAQRALRTTENGWQVESLRNNLKEAPISSHFGHTNFLHLQFHSTRQEEWEDFWGRLCSFPSAPKEEHPKYRQNQAAARALFEHFSLDGLLEITYVTELFLGECL